MITGFTGTHHGMSLAQKTIVRVQLISFYEPGGTNIFHMGDCVGSDIQAADMAWEIGYDVVVHPPTNPKNRFFWSLSARVKARPDQKCTVLEEKEYLKRDYDIVGAVQIMLGTPADVVEELRSGTWATIRFTRKSKIKLYIVYPDGSIGS